MKLSTEINLYKNNAIASDIQQLQNTTSKTIKTATTLYYLQKNETPIPSAPTAHVITTGDVVDNWTTSVPVINKDRAGYAYYYICTEYRYSDESYSWSKVECDRQRTFTQGMMVIDDNQVKFDGGKIYASDAFIKNIFAKDITLENALMSKDYNGSLLNPLGNSKGTIFKMNDGTMNLGGGKIKWDGTDLTINAKTMTVGNVNAATVNDINLVNDKVNGILNDIDDLNTKTDNAITAANGKNKIYHCAYANRPTSGLTANDILFDTANGYKMYRYNGSSWIAEQFGTGAIIAGAIKAEQIDANAVTTAKLDTGAVTADKITANEALINKIFAYDVTAKNSIIAPILKDEEYDGTNNGLNNTKGSIINLRDSKISLGKKLEYDETNGLVLNGNLTATNGTITGVTLNGEDLNISAEREFTIHNDFTDKDELLVRRTNIETIDNLSSEFGISKLQILKSLSIGNAEASSFLTMMTSGLLLPPVGVTIDTQLELGTSNIDGSSKISLWNGRMKLEASSLSLSASDIQFTCSDTSSSTYTKNECSGNVLSSASITVKKIYGMCFISGGITLTGTVSDWIQILDSSAIPIPLHLKTIYQTACRWASSYERGLRVRINSNGGLSIRYGGAYEYMFDFCYPCI